MKPIILDTNFLLIPHQFKINIIAEIERLIEGAHKLIVSEPIIAELEGLGKERGKEGVAARVALEIIQKNKIQIIKSKEKNADKWIIDYCSKHSAIVCTNDFELRKELKKKTDAQIIVMRTRTRIFWA